jgi:transposase
MLGELRQLLIHGARSALRVGRAQRRPAQPVAPALKARRHTNVAAVALANKLARIAYVILATGLPYDPEKLVTTT